MVTGIVDDPTDQIGIFLCARRAVKQLAGAPRNIGIKP
jgi:hypothetical protein